jgi:PAS domain S-box-containing protein
MVVSGPKPDLESSGLPSPLVEAPSAVLESFIEHAPIRLAMFDREMRYVAASKRWESAHNMRLAEVKGRCVYDVFPDIPQRWRDEHRRALDGRACQGEDEVQTPSGEVQSLRWSMHPYGSSGNPEGLIVFCEDVTAERQAERALRESEQRFRTVLENSGDIIYRFNLLTKRLDYMSPSCEQVLGYSPMELMAIEGQAWAETVHPDDWPLVQAAFTQVAETGRTEVEFRRRKKDGEYCWLSCRILLARDNSGVPLYRYGTMRDITERKLADEKNAALTLQLLEVQKLEAVGRLAGGIAHEFNNLLMVIQTYAELLRQRHSGDDRVARSTEKILQAAERGAGLASQMLAFSRRRIVTPTFLDLNTTISRALSPLRELAAKSIELSFMGADALWEVEADQNQLFQVLVNLCQNSRDAMPQGGNILIATRNARVAEGDVAGLAPGNYVCFSVTDTGAGIPKEIQHEIFEPFFSTKKLGKGTGLGLSTVYGIVKQSGGHIVVESEPGHGARFSIYLPAVNREVTAARSIQDGQMAGGSETVLVVEDETPLREGILEFLTTLGYTVLTATTAEEALSLALESGHIDLLLTDVVLPGMNGRELSKTLAAMRPELKIIHMSGYTDDATLRFGIHQPNVSFLEKPFGLKTLADKLRALLNQD